MSKKTLARVILLLVALGPAALAADQYLVRVPSSKIGDVVARHGLTLLRSLQGSARGFHVVLAPSGTDPRDIASDPSVQDLEEDSNVLLPEAAPDFQGQASLQVNGLGAPTALSFFGVQALGAYVEQPAGAVIALDGARNIATGAGTVAVLDTGVDPNHPVLKNSLVPGYDFTRNIPGGSEMNDLDQSTTAILDDAQSTTAILDKTQVMVLNQSTTAILDQSTTAILDRASLPGDFGHGTMVAGLVHLVAPAAKIMPVKVFTGDGAATLSQIVAGIAWAVDNGANVVSMSFSSPTGSEAMKKVIAEAIAKGVVLVAAAGNDGEQIVVYPAGYGIIGVGSTDDWLRRSSFSNYGSIVTVAAPGEGVITLYPGNNYAAGWGTSFSAPLVAGGAALLVQLGSTNQSQAAQALSQAVFIGQQLGAGELNLVMACWYGAWQRN
ncbi:MAG: S8 family serine peptidase [Bryobacteraceae bacterium]